MINNGDNNCQATGRHGLAQNIAAPDPGDDDEYLWKCTCIAGAV